MTFGPANLARQLRPSPSVTNGTALPAVLVPFVTLDVPGDLIAECGDLPSDQGTGGAEGSWASLHRRATSR